MTYSSVRSHRLRFGRFCAVLFCLLLLLLAALAPRPVAAHGGVVIDSGFTPNFEWLVMINPYPIETGEATITLLVYDLTKYDPVNDLKPTLFMAKPGTTRPCCKAEELSAPITLTIDPQIYPGDYSAPITFDQPGDWALQFVAEGGDRSFTVVVSVPVKAAVTVTEATPLGGASNVTATQTGFTQNVQSALQQNSPLTAALSPLTPTNTANDLTAAVVHTQSTRTFLGLSLWLWGIAALIPIGMGWWLLRSPQEQEEE